MARDGILHRRVGDWSASWLWLTQRSVARVKFFNYRSNSVLRWSGKRSSGSISIFSARSLVSAARVDSLANSR
jgi:hypothetical protein